MSKFLTFSLLVSLFLSFASPASAAVVIGDPCTTLGVTTATTDLKDIAACLQDDNGALVWKGMANDTMGSWCGLAVVQNQSSTLSHDGNCQNRGPSYTVSNSTQTPTFVAKCRGVEVFTYTSNSSSRPSGLRGGSTSQELFIVNNCPSGYVLKTISGPTSSSNSNTGSCEETSSSSSSVYYFCIRG